MRYNKYTYLNDSSFALANDLVKGIYVGNIMFLCCGQKF